jgi:hypothetical protein
VSDLDPEQVVASFDSASVLHAAAAAALEGQPFRNLGSSALAGLAVRAAGRLPWSVLRGVYTRIGASEGINPRRLVMWIWLVLRRPSPSAIRSGAMRRSCSARAMAR